MSFAFFFPGQGSQSLNMMDGFAGQSVVKNTFDEASAVLGQDLWAMINGQEEHECKTLFRCLMSEGHAAEIRAHPAAEQCRQEQAVFGNAVLSLYGTPFVYAVKCKRVEG